MSRDVAPMTFGSGVWSICAGTTTKSLLDALDGPGTNVHGERERKNESVESR